MNEKLAKIVALVKIKGPIVPNQISHDIKCDGLLASAMLSDLVSTKHLAVSSLKYGSSPLYYLPEQKPSLEAFADNLPAKEHSAYLLIKEHKILEDVKLEPAIRLAMRSIKDFAVPIQITQNKEEKLYWRFYSFSKEQALEKLNPVIPKEKKIKKKEIKKAEKADIKKEAKQIEVKQEIIKPEEIIVKKEHEKELDLTPEPEITSVPELIKKPARKKRTINLKAKISAEEKSKIKGCIENFTKLSGLSIVEEKKFAGDEVYMTILMNSILGNLPYLLVFKNKEILTKKDLTDAYKKGMKSKMPVLFMTKGKLDEKAQKYAESIKGHLIFKQIES